MNIAVFVSGRGSNLKAILNSELLRGKVKVKAVISDKLKCDAFEIAKENLVKCYSLGKSEGCINYTELEEILVSLNIDLIVLAGFLKLIPVSFWYQNTKTKLSIFILPFYLRSEERECMV